jgi:integrase
VALEYALDRIARILRPNDPEATARNTPWYQLDPVHVDAIVAVLAESYAPATANQYLAALRGLIKTLGRLGLLPADTERRLLDFKLRKNNRPLSGRALSMDEIKQLFATCDDGSIVGVRNAALLALAFHGGMRRDEIARATIDWLAEDRAEIRIVGKGGKIREVPLAASARHRLDAWLDATGATSSDAPLIRRVSRAGALGAVLTVDGVYSVLHAIGRKSGVTNFTPHDLRRTFVTELLARGVDVVTTARMAGHSDVRTTMLYDRRLKDVARSAAATLNLEGP